VNERARHSNSQQQQPPSGTDHASGLSESARQVPTRLVRLWECTCRRMWTHPPPRQRPRAETMIHIFEATTPGRSSHDHLRLSAHTQPPPHDDLRRHKYERLNRLSSRFHLLHLCPRPQEAQGWCIRLFRTGVVRGDDARPPAPRVTNHRRRRSAVMSSDPASSVVVVATKRAAEPVLPAGARCRVVVHSSAVADRMGGVR
jgi:hypothetical protein